MEITFKPAGRSELEVLLHYMRAFYEHERLSFDEQKARAALEQLLGDAALGRVWLICGGGEAIGYAVLTFGFSLEYRGRDAFVDELYVQASHRGRGAGARTLQFLEETCRALGIRALHLEVERANTGAHALYRKVGYEDHDRYLMTKWIAS